MDDQAKTRQQLIGELIEMRRRVAELEANSQITDTSRTKHAEEALRQSQERLELALKGADLGLWDYNLQTGEALVSARRAEMVGYSLEEVDHHITWWGKQVHAEDSDRIRKAFNAYVKGRTPLYESEHRLRHKSGQYIWILARGKVVEWDEQGNPVRMVGTSLDITDRKRNEEALQQAHQGLERRVEERTSELTRANRQLEQEISRRRRAEEERRDSEHKLATILSTSPVALCLTKGRIIQWVNDAWVKMFRFENENEYIGNDTRIVFPTDREYQEVGFLYDRQKKGLLAETDTKMKRADGSVFDAHIRTTNFDPADHTRGTITTVSDITERKRMEEVLRQSEEKYRSVVENMQNVFYRLNMEGNVILVSPSGPQMMGYESVDQMIGLNVSDVFYKNPEDRDRLLTILRERGKVSNYELELVRKDGSSITVSSNSHIYYDKSGEPLGTEGVLTDITERKRAEEALRESEEKYRLLVENANEAIFVLQDARAKFVNLVCEEIMGFPADVLRSKPFLEFVHPDDREMALQRQMRHLRGEEVDSRYPLRVIDKHGAVKWIEINTVPINWEGGPAALILATDTTQRQLAEQALRASERKFRLVTETIQDVFWMSTPGIQHMVYISPAYEKVWGRPTESLCKSPQSFFEVVHPDDRKQLMSILQEHHSNGKEYACEYRIIPTDDSLRWIHERGFPIHDDQGKLMLMCGVCTDITERKLMEGALRQSEERFSLAIEGSRVGIVDWDVPSGRMVWTPRVFTLLGYEPDEFEPTFSLVIDKFIHSQDLEHLLHQILVHHQAHEAAETECRVNTKDGTVKWLRLSGHSSWDPEGRPLRTVWTVEDITERKKANEALRESEQRVKAKLDSILVPEVDIGALELADIIDTQAIQSIMDSFFKLTNIGFAILDLHGKVLVSTGWEDICAQFHRVHAETSKYCLESDTVLSRDVQPNTFKIYKCKNNMWDIATPIMIGEEHMGNLFMGQFFFEDEQPDYEAFRSRARQYGFDEEAYLAALDRVPRRTREMINTVMTFNMQFAQMIATLSHSNVKLARTLTERRRAEEALKESEEWYRSIVEESFDGIFVQKGPEIIFANSRLYEMLGYSAGELEHMDHWLIYHPDYQEIVRERAKARMRGEIFSHEYEVKLQRKDGSHFDGEVNARAVTVEGGPGVRVWVRDVSKRKRLEEVQRRLATAIEQSAEAVVITDRRGHVEYVNPAHQRITGYSREEVIGSLPPLFNQHDMDPKVRLELSNSLARGATWSGRASGMRKDGTLCQMDITISPVRDASGRIVNLVGVERDITEEVRLQEQLLQAQKMEAVGTLAGGIAHDFNNLLTVVMGFAELLLDEKDRDHPDFADLHKILHAAKNGAELVQRLLMFSRKSEPKPIPMNLNRQIVRVEKLLRRTIPRMIDIRLDLASDLPEINADPSQIEQVLINLAVNARDAMPDAGKLTVRTDIVTLDEEYCRLHVDVKPGEYVALEMSDTGQGMDKETLEHIFEPFFTTKEMGRGTGLGLAMVYGIVTQHNGHITVYSELGKGTTFRVYLPAIPAHMGPEVEDSSIRPAFGTETVLLVDDEELLRELGARILTTHGYTVLQAEDVGEALDLFKKERARISLVILDLIMPEMGGTECLNELLKIDPLVNVLVASGYPADASIREAMEMGAKGSVQKPFRVKELLREVRKVLDKTGSASQ